MTHCLRSLEQQTRRWLLRKAAGAAVSTSGHPRYYNDESRSNAFRILCSKGIIIWGRSDIRFKGRVAKRLPRGAQRSFFLCTLSKTPAAQSRRSTIRNRNHIGIPFRFEWYDEIYISSNKAVTWSINSIMTNIYDAASIQNCNKILFYIMLFTS